MIPADNSSTLLMVVDAQRIFAHAADPDGRCVGYIARHIDRGGYGHISYTRFINRADSLPATLLGYDKSMAQHPSALLCSTKIDIALERTLAISNNSK